MKLKLNFQPLGVDANGSIACRRGWCLMAVFLGWLSVRGAEPIMPLVTPSIVPFEKNPDGESSTSPELGFPGAPADGTGPLPMEDGLTPLPATPEEFLDASAFAADDPVGPVAEADPALIADAAASEESVGFADGGASSESGTGDFASLPPLPGGMDFGNNWPRGFAEFPGSTGLGGGLLDDIRDGLSLSAALSGTYDTNPSRGYSQTANPGQAADSDEGDFFLSLVGAVSYLSRSSTWTYGARYTGGYSQYFSQSELSGYYQNAGASLNYNGGPLTASLNVGVNFGSGANRYYESVVDEISYNYALNARYRINSKTSLTGDLSQRFTSASGNANRDTESLDLGTSALWRYSPLLEFGPGIRYTSRSGDSTQERTSIGPTLTANYELSRKISLNSRIGVDFAEFEDGESADPSLFTSIGLNYRASQLWSMNLSLLRDNQASYTASGEFEEMMALRLGYNRKIRRAVWSLGMGWETRSVENSSGTTNTRPDRDYLTLDTSLGMPVFRNTCNASIFMRYSDQSGDTNQSWDSLQTGFSISRSF